MSDRELLELAAKAAGLTIIHWNEDGPRIQSEGCKTGYFWTPLSDDGDAFRLLVKLRLPLRDGFNGTVETGNEKSGWPIWELYGDDPHAATRRAIVRAAAEIELAKIRG